MIIRNKKIMFSIALIIMILIVFAGNVFAIDPNDPKWNPEPDISEGGSFVAKAGKILGFIKYIGAIISVLALSIIGIKYMFSSVEGKAEYKKTMLPYIIGCFLLGFITVVLTVIENLAKA